MAEHRTAFCALAQFEWNAVATLALDAIQNRQKGGKQAVGAGKLCPTLGHGLADAAKDGCELAQAPAELLFEKQVGVRARPFAVSRHLPADDPQGDGLWRRPQLQEGIDRLVQTAGDAAAAGRVARLDRGRCALLERRNADPRERKFNAGVFDAIIERGKGRP